MAKDKLKVKIELTDRVNWVTRSADRLKRMVPLYQMGQLPLPLLRREAWLHLKRSWELWWHLRWVKPTRKDKGIYGDSNTGS